MPGCGEVPQVPLIDGCTPIPVPSIPAGTFDDDKSEATNPPFVRDLTVPELEELIEKAVRRVLQGEDIKREFERLEAAKKHK